MIDIIDAYVEKFKVLNNLISISENGEHYLMNRRVVADYIKDKYSITMNEFFHKCDEGMISYIVNKYYYRSRINANNIIYTVTLTDENSTWTLKTPQTSSNELSN